MQQSPANPEADKLPTEAYSYDPVHNRLSSQHQPGPWQYNADNQLHGYGIGPERRTYTYNPNGHTSTEVTGDPVTKTREFIYNAAERLAEIKDNTQTIGQYQYDPMGRRIKKQTQEGTTWFVYADEGLIAELDQTGNPTRYYGWQPEGLWGTDPVWLADKSGSTWQAYLYHNDHLWMPQRLTNQEGQTQWSGRAEAFGKTAATINAIDNTLRFPGQYHDLKFDHYYNFHRHYYPVSGRYVQSDPEGLLGGVNIYAYSTASPIIFIDPLGLFRFTISCNAEQRAKIVQAINDVIWDLTIKCLFGDDSCEECEGCKYYRKLTLYYTNHVSFQCGGTTSCGQTMVNGHTAINPSEMGSSPSCGCLKATIFHEAMHNMDKKFEGTGKDAEDRTKGAERSCFTCGK